MVRDTRLDKSGQSGTSADRTPHHLVYAVERMQRVPRSAQAARIETSMPCIPGDEAMRALQTQLGGFVQFLFHGIGAKPCDPLKVQGGSAVPNAAIGAPDAKNVFRAGRDCRGDRIGRLALHDGLTILFIRPLPGAKPSVRPHVVLIVISLRPRIS